MSAGLAAHVVQPALVCALLATVVCQASNAADGDTHLHVGAAMCKRCHSQGQGNANVALDEYITWDTKGWHARAYRLLAEPQSVRIASKLGLSNGAQEAKICLDCHADNTPYRGPKFQPADGVSCEACHGGAEKWIELHAEGVPRSRNLALGMYPTEQPGPRADLCLSCHMGTEEKFVTHTLLGAGHPPLSFELEVFTALQPPHYVVDADYRSRKGEIGGAELWLAGQIAAARQFLRLVQSDLLTAPPLTAELSFFDCYACHKPVENREPDLRWSRQRAGPGVGPGSLRPQKHYLITLLAFAGVADSPAAMQELSSLVQLYSRSALESPAVMRREAGRLLDWLDRRQIVWSQKRLDNVVFARVRLALLDLAAAGQSGDYQIAEQVTFGVESISRGIGDFDRHSAAIDRLYATIDSPSAFDPDAFAAVARSVRPAF